jgi:hypothetical protein
MLVANKQLKTIVKADVELSVIISANAKAPNMIEL